MRTPTDPTDPEVDDVRQIIMNSAGAMVARVPRPTAADGTVLVRVQYSLISVGTETASLASVWSGAGVSRTEAVTKLARTYARKAAADPKKAAQRVRQIVENRARATLSHQRARLDARLHPTPPAASVASAAPTELRWQKASAELFEAANDGFHLVTDGTAHAYQVVSAPIARPPDTVALVRVSGHLGGGPVHIGLLSDGRQSWLGSNPIEAGPVDDSLYFSGAANEVSFVISAGDQGPSTFDCEHISVTFVPVSDSGLPVSELDQQGWATGYSCAGEIIAVGQGVTDLAVGDLVACAGAGQANHADVVSVKRRLVARIPKGCSIADAASATVGAIALQGVRRAEVQLGDRVAVIGLGLIGQLTAQLLAASGCRVIGLDLDAERVQRALSLGMAFGATDASLFEQLIRDATEGNGVDRTIITASSKSSAIINQAMKITRRRGRVVIVGDVGLEVERADFYRKEIDLIMSTSYGPGRYDATYENDGHDYPYGYVRWTLNRNLSAFLELVSTGRVKVAPLVDRVAAVEDAPAVYAELAGRGEHRPLAVLFGFGAGAGVDGDATSITVQGHRRPTADVVNVALVGAGAFGTSMLAPQVMRNRETMSLRGVVSADPVRAGNFARTNRVEVLATDLDAVLADPRFDMLMIATRHNRHAAQTTAGLRAGKHVFVEKPLALTWDELDDVMAAAHEHPELMLMVGFNRRFAPATQALAAHLAGRRSPLVINYRLNAGYVPLDSWLHGPEGGGRNIGEACHMYDVFRFLAGAPVRSVSATSIDPGSGPFTRSDNFIATLSYEDGSAATLTYCALGPKEGLPKERVEVFVDGRHYLLDDFRSLTVSGEKEPLWRGDQDKGHAEEILRVGLAVKRGSAAPISRDELFETSAIALQIEDLLYGREAT